MDPWILSHSLCLQATDDHTDDDIDDRSPFSEPWGWDSKFSACFAVALYGVLAWENWLLEMTYTSRFNNGADVFGRVLSFCFMGSLVIFAGTVGSGFSDAYDMSWAFIAHGFATLFSILKYARGIICNPEDAKPLRAITIPLLIDCVFFFVASSEVYNSMENAIIIAISAKVFRNALITFNWLRGGLAGKDYYKMATQIDAHYVTERFGLLSIIVIGETILSVVSGVKAGAYSQGIEVPNLIYSFIIVFSNWWIYFDNLSESVVSYHKRGLFVTYFHECIMIANCFLAAGLGSVLSQEAGEKVPEAVVGLFCFAYALTCAMQFMIRIVTCWSAKAISQNRFRYLLRW